MLSYTFRMVKKISIIACLLLAHTTFYGQTDVGFIGFQMSDTVTVGGTLELTGTLYNNGNTIIPANLSMEVAAESEFSSDPSEAYASPSFTENFYNPAIAPGESYTFTKQIWVDPQHFIPNQNAVIIIWPVESLIAPDSDTLNNIYQDTIRVQDYRDRLKDYNRRTEPIIMQGSDFPSELVGLNINDIVGFKYENDAWQQIPIQIDEMALIDIITPYGFQSLPSEPIIAPNQQLFYTDSSTYTGADPDPNFDLNDQLVFMAKDAGVQARTNIDPPGTIAGTGFQINITEPLNYTRSYVYIYQQNGSLSQDAGINYVNYDFKLTNGEKYPQGYDFDGNNPEDSRVTTPFYDWHFSDTWISDEAIINIEQTTKKDLLNSHLSLFGPDICEQNEEVFSQNINTFITNKVGPIRAIRTYMGAGNDLFTQRTHIFYEGKQDIITNIKTDVPLFYFDLFDYNNNVQNMSYSSNSFIDGRIIDGSEDNAINDLPAQWEMITGEQGTLFIIHDVKTQDTIQTLEGALGNYWSDNTLNPNFNCSGTATEYGTSGISIDFTELCTTPSNADCNPDNFLEMKRTVYFAEPNLNVLDIFVHQQYTKNPMTYSWQYYTPPCYRAELATWLEGANNNLTGEINTNLNQRGLLPGQTPMSELTIATPAGQPFHAAPWNYSGTEGRDFTDADYLDKDVDWVLIYLQTTNRYTIDKAAAILQKDGTIRFADNCPFEIIQGFNDFHLIAEHRNHAGITTPNPIQLEGNLITFDFRTTPLISEPPITYGYKEIAPNLWGMYAGDADKISDVGGYDINAADKILWFNANGTFDKYLNTDFNLDGTADGGDKMFWNPNNGNFIPIQH